MGDMGEVFNDWREAKKEKRRDNRSASTALLAEAGLAYESRNGGVHLVVGRFDFWPSTGLFIERGTNRRGRGVRNLIAKVTHG